MKRTTVAILLLLAFAIFLATKPPDKPLPKKPEADAVSAFTNSRGTYEIIPNLSPDAVSASANPTHMTHTTRRRARKAQQGDATNQMILGGLYYRGKGGLPQDYTKAVYWWRKSAKQNNAVAQMWLGTMYARGKGGLLQDYTKAAYWWHKAVKQSYYYELGEAQFGLGLLYGYGRGVPKNPVLARMWFNIASASGYENARKFRHKVAVDMSKEDIRRATALAHKCMASKYKTCGNSQRDRDR